MIVRTVFLDHSTRRWVFYESRLTVGGPWAWGSLSAFSPCLILYTPPAPNCNYVHCGARICLL